MTWHIAQLNVGTARYDLDDERMSGFMERLDEVNALADASPGFVWRLQTEAGNATDIKVTDNPRFILNLSVWETIEQLADFVYQTSHQPVLADRLKWFEKPSDAILVLWWIEAGTVPTIEAALERLEMLRGKGPTPEAFTFRTTFPPPGSAAS
jgi:hypothetical protein